MTTQPKSRTEHASWLLSLACTALAGCPFELRCVTVDPRPSPVTQGELDEALVEGLDDCGHLSDGRLGALNILRIDAAATESAASCARQCALDLTDDCQALYQVACLGVMPRALAKCVQACSCRSSEGRTPRPCKQGLVQCGLRSGPGMASASTTRSFSCADGSGAVRASQVCDLVSDCADRSDEAAEQKCAELACGTEAR
jgi:hypothetical protein